MGAKRLRACRGERKQIPGANARTAKDKGENNKPR